jgi:hypothetical protein
MTEAGLRIATALASALEAENDALRRMDVVAVVAGLTAKSALTARLREALADPERRTGAMPPAVRACAERLDRVAEENRRLLERAMAVQGQLIAILARAMPRAPAGYGGAVPAAARRFGSVSVGPIALCARA